MLRYLRNYIKLRRAKNNNSKLKDPALFKEEANLNKLLHAVTQNPSLQSLRVQYRIKIVNFTELLWNPLLALFLLALNIFYILLIFFIIFIIRHFHPHKLISLIGRS